MRSLWVTGGVLLLLLTSLLLPTHAQPKIIIRFGHDGGVESLYQLTAQEFAKRLDKELGGRVEVRIFPNSQVGSDEELIRTLRGGALEMFLPSTIMGAVDDGFGVFEMPYIIINRTHMKRVADNAEIQRILLDPQALKGLRVLAFWENGFRDVTNNARPIVRPDDLRGLKIRIPRSPWRQRILQVYGANPVPMTFSDVHKALQDGVVDGQENPLAQIWGAKFYEVQRYLSLTGHVYTPVYPTAGERWWQALPPDVRIVMRRVAVEVGDYSRAEGERLDASLVQQMTKANPALKVNEVDTKAFMIASAALYEQFSKEVSSGAGLIRLVQSLRP
jgi:tripartite ATP-independent transporter DctP family solute receptor